MMSAGTRTGGDGPDARSLGALLEDYRPRLRRMVSLRLDPRLRARVDASDVIQEAFIDVTRRYEEYLATRAVPLFVWVRFLTAQKLTEFHRRHLGAMRRDARWEKRDLAYPESSSTSLARALVDQGTSPSEALARKDREERLRAALEEMKDVDREILLLRHFEQLSNAECAAVLKLSPPGAYLRHVRAAKRLREILRRHGDLPAGLVELPEEEEETEGERWTKGSDARKRNRGG